MANFWFKQLTSLHPELASAYNNILKKREQSSEWLTEGVTFLIPKSEDRENSKNYRPITCLPTMYKVLTSVITDAAAGAIRGTQREYSSKPLKHGCIVKRILVFKL